MVLFLCEHYVSFHRDWQEEVARAMGFCVEDSLCNKVASQEKPNLRSAQYRLRTDSYVPSRCDSKEDCRQPAVRVRYYV